jgi:hypothetical protein
MPCDKADRGLRAGLFMNMGCLSSSLHDTGGHEPTFIAQSPRHPIFWCDAACLLVPRPLPDAAQEALNSRKNTK